MSELEVKEMLQDAAEEMIRFSNETAAPIEDVVCSSRSGETEAPIEIVVLFSEVEQLKNMEEQKLKDSFMSVFLKYLTAHDFPFGKQPQLKFQFSVSIN